MKLELDNFKRLANLSTKHKLLILILFCIINNYIWISKYSFLPLAPDESYHLIQSLKFYKILKNHPLSGLKEWWYFVPQIYPPLFTFSSAILNLAFGTSKIVSTMTNSIYLIILVLAVYFIGKKIANKNTGLLSAFIISVYPLVFGMQRWFMLDFALCSMVAFSIACLLYTENFTSRKFSLLFGLSLGLGMLAKQTFFIFLFVPFLYLALRSLEKCKSSLLNIISAMIIGFLVSLIYFNLPRDTLKYWFSKSNPYTHIPVILDITSWRTFAGATHYLRSLFWQISPFFTLIFLLAFIPYLKSKTRYKTILLSWLFIPLIIFTFISITNKWARYIMPILPAIAVISAVGLLEIKWRKIKTGIISLIIAVGLYQYLLISYNRNIKYHHQTFMCGLQPDKDEIKLSKIVNRLIPDYIIPYNSANNTINIGVVETVPLMMVSEALRYSIIEKDLNCKLISFLQRPELFWEKKGDLDYIIIFRNTDNNIWPTEEEIKQVFKVERLDLLHHINENEYKLFTENFSQLSREFKLIKKIGCADKFYFFLLKRVISFQPLLELD